MKNSRILALSILVMVQGCQTMNMSIKDPAQDKVLKQIHESLPEGWQMVIKQDVLEISRGEEITLLYQNSINAPLSLETPQQKAERIKKYGKKVKSILRFRLEPLWDEQKIQTTQEHNRKIHDEINKLPEKLNITHLYNTFLSSKGQVYFNEGTEQENNRVAEYQEQKKKLESKLIALPEYSTEKASLFLMDFNGVSDEYQQVFPESADREGNTVLGLFSRYASAYGK